jgi:hypothetical protein
MDRNTRLVAGKVPHLRGRTKSGCLVIGPSGIARGVAYLAVRGVILLDITSQAEHSVTHV